MAPPPADRPADRSRQRSGNPAVRGGAQAPRTPSPRPVRPSEESLPGRLPEEGAPYPLVLRHEGTQRWRGLLGVVFGLSLYLLMQTVVTLAVLRLAWALDHPVDYRTYYDQAIALQRPIGLLASNLGIVVLIPISFVLVLVVHQTRTRWLFSVGPGIRWRFLLICLATSTLGFAVVQTIAELSAPSGRLSPQPGFWAFLAVIVLTSPIQAAAEEIFFRGYAMQALGSLVAQPWFGVVASSVVFALLHGSQNLALFVNRLVFGLLAGLLVWWVGGLEAGIAAHVMNNLVAFVWASLTTSVAALRAVSSLTWLQSGVQILGFVLCAGLAMLVARLLRLRTRVDLTATGVTTATPRGLSAGGALR